MIDLIFMIEGRNIDPEFYNLMVCEGMIYFSLGMLPDTLNT